MNFQALLPSILLGVGGILIVLLLYSYRQQISNYYRETRAELGKVSWPTRAEAVNLTIVVLVTVVVSSLFLGFFDAVFTWLFAQLI
ncbi:MAG: preprotein translocase subunit SecE [Anaerolineales bacterium]